MAYQELIAHVDWPVGAQFTTATEIDVSVTNGNDVPINIVTSSTKPTQQPYLFREIKPFESIEFVLEADEKLWLAAPGLGKSAFAQARTPITSVSAIIWY